MECEKKIDLQPMEEHRDIRRHYNNNNNPFGMHEHDVIDSDDYDDDDDHDDDDNYNHDSKCLLNYYNPAGKYPEGEGRPTSTATVTITTLAEHDTNSMIKLSDVEVSKLLKIKGGQEELRMVLKEGHEARNELIRKNVRLVVSIAQKWCKISSSGAGSTHTYAAVYAGDWQRPSLDEAVQEGIVGLAEAAERYDWSYGYKFATYATYWITNRVRRCFRDATGCMRVPSFYHDVKIRYRIAMKNYYEETNPSLDELRYPPIEDIAEECGVSVRVLKRALRATQSYESIDQPISQHGNNNAGAPGKSGADTGEESHFTLLQSLASYVSYLNCCLWWKYLCYFYANLVRMCVRFYLFTCKLDFIYCFISLQFFQTFEKITHMHSKLTNTCDQPYSWTA